MARTGRRASAGPDGVTSEQSVRERLLSTGVSCWWRGEPPDAFTGLAVDSRRVRQGELFCAVRGIEHDGHEFLGDAVESGAAAAVVEEPRPGVDLPQLTVEDSRLAVAHLASLFHGDPASDLSLVAVTGTNGKTTTAWIARHLLGAMGPAASVGTLGTVCPDGEIAPDELTTPGPLELMATLESLADRGAAVVTVEVSSHALDQRRADALEFDVAVFTTFSREHLEYHATMDEYLASKLHLVELVQPGGSCAVLARERAWRSGDFTDRQVVEYGLETGAEVRGEDLRTGRNGSTFRLVTPEGARRVRLPLPGAMNVENALGAAAAARARGLSLDEIAGRLETVPQVPGRFEVLRSDPPSVVRDYAHTPAAIERALETLRGGVDGRILVVFGAGGDRDPGKRPLMGEVVARLADYAYVTTDNPRSEDPGRIAEDVTTRMDPDVHEIVLDREEAIRRAMQRAGDEDLVLLLGKGHETYQVVDGRREPFDEAEVVRRLARERGS